MLLPSSPSAAAIVKIGFQRQKIDNNKKNKLIWRIMIINKRLWYTTMANKEKIGTFVKLNTLNTFSNLHSFLSILFLHKSRIATFRLSMCILHCHFEVLMLVYVNQRNYFEITIQSSNCIYNRITAMSLWGHTNDVTNHVFVSSPCQ